MCSVCSVFLWLYSRRRPPLSLTRTLVRQATKYVNTVPERQGATMMNVPFETHDVVRVGSIGIGGRGGGQLNEMLAVEGAQIVAIADQSQDLLDDAEGRIVAAGQDKPAVFTDWKQLCEMDGIDLVYICTGWEAHVPMACYAMECGKHAAVEVPAAVTLADCWKLVDTSERTRRHCVQLENCCYGQQEMMVMNMIEAGVFGTLTHGEAAYIHEMRASLLGSKSANTPNWRRKAITANDGNLYPTHGLGPVAQYMGIHKGDRFAKMVSMSSPSAALTDLRDRTVDSDDPRADEEYLCGDMNTSIIKTELGRTIVLQHDIVTPRPYSRANLIQGSRGTFSDYPPQVFIDHAGDDSHAEMGAHDWEDAGPESPSMEEYEHPLWKDFGDLARKLGGHGGMDFVSPRHFLDLVARGLVLTWKVSTLQIMNYRLIQAMREGTPPDMDVYDAAAWSAPGPLSFICVAHDIAVQFPDFSRGAWDSLENSGGGVAAVIKEEDAVEALAARL